MASDQERIDNFWREYIAVGKEVLLAGSQIGYGMSLIEVKFQAGLPSVVVRSVTQNKKYPSSQDAKIAIGKMLEDSIAGGYNGAMTFTVVMTPSGINRVLLDEYANKLLS